MNLIQKHILHFALEFLKSPTSLIYVLHCNMNDHAFLSLLYYNFWSFVNEGMSVLFFWVHGEWIGVWEKQKAQDPHSDLTFFINPEK